MLGFLVIYFCLNRSDHISFHFYLLISFVNLFELFICRFSEMARTNDQSGNQGESNNAVHQDFEAKSICRFFDYVANPVEQEIDGGQRLDSHDRNQTGDFRICKSACGF